MNDITMIGHISRDIMIYREDKVRLTGGRRKEEGDTGLIKKFPF